MRALVVLFSIATVALGSAMFWRTMYGYGIPREIPVAQNETSSSPGRAPASFASQFQVSQSVLAELEKDREHLRQYAHAEPMAGGWVIHIQPSDQVFSRLGFHEGQTITFEMLSREPQLTDRMVDILRSIEQ